MVSARISDSRYSKGYRATIYQTAQECHAYYCQEGKDKSIFYEEGSNDLTIRLLFASTENGEDFQNELSNFGFKFPAFAEKIFFDRKLQTITLEELPDRILFRDYNADYNTDSPPFLSLNDLLSSHSESVLSNNGDPERALQSLEDLTKFPNLKCYKCHIISRKVEEYKDNPDNRIYSSWIFHQYFDGLDTESNYPELAVKFESVSGQEDVPIGNDFARRWKINVIVVFRDEELAKFMSSLFKVGTQQIQDNPLRYQSFLYARNANDMQYFLEHKYNETTKLWENWAESMD
jgi:hypothetical protein